MKIWIHASTDITDGTAQLAKQIANSYELIEVTPEADTVLKGDAILFRVNDHNVYRVVVNSANRPSGRNPELIFQRIALAYMAGGHEHFDTPVDFDSIVAEYKDMFSIIKSWVAECEINDPEFTEYEED